MKVKKDIFIFLALIFFVAGLSFAFSVNAQYVTYNKLRELSRVNRAEAIQLANEALQKDPSRVEVRVLLARMYAWSKQYAKARHALKDVFVQYPQYLDVWIAAIDIEIWSKNYSQAVKLCDEALKNLPNNKILIEKKMFVQRRIKAAEKRKVKVDFKKISKLAQTNSAAAIQLAQQALKEDPTNNDIRILLARIYAWNKQYKMARVELNKVLIQQPNYLDARLALIDVEIWNKNYQQAIKEADIGLKYAPDNKQLQDKKKLAKERSEGKVVIKKDEEQKKLTISTYKEIRALAKTNRKEAIKQAQARLKEKPDDSDTRVLLGRMYGWNKQYAKARAEFDYVLKNKPDYVDARLGLIDVELWSKNYAQAIKQANKGLEYAPDNQNFIDKKVLAQKRSIKKPEVSETPERPFRASFDIFRERLVAREPEDKANEFLFFQRRTDVSDLDNDWHRSIYQYKRKTPIGSIIGRVNRYKKFGKHGIQYEIDAYPKLRKGTYLYSNYGYSETSYLPRHRAGAEIFQSFPRSYEGSLGFRRLIFENSNTTIYTGSIGKYIGNFWFVIRTYISPKDIGGYSKSFYFTARRFFRDADEYISLTFGGGQGPTSDDEPEDVDTIRKESIRLGGKIPLIRKKLYIRISGRLKKEVLSNEVERMLARFGAGIEWHF